MIYLVNKLHLYRGFRVIFKEEPELTNGETMVAEINRFGCKGFRTGYYLA